MSYLAGTKNNRRTLYTKKVIREAFLELLSQQELSKITVTEITEKAEINRGTFYKYFQDPLDLFQTIEEELTAEILPLMQLRSSDDLAIWLQRFIAVLNQNKVVSLTLLKSSSTTLFVTTIFSEVHDLAISQFSQMFDETNPIVLELFFTYFAKGTIGMIVEWMQLDSDISVEEISIALSKVLISQKKS
ncbi:TetR/AcrR family transcriptional regulator [Enterococcus sp. HY326]|uniref:TetR/AcrR family transcriptional regulator n=1 Tax=Enterococcus sp. HY326 TaxID=2971265 RepID=UPI002240B7C4|nr:TetR/AcrR family transcriptional regulator [Enterococcus sp. HY326]